MKKVLYGDLKTTVALNQVACDEPIRIKDVCKAFDLPYHIVYYRLQKLSRMGYVKKVTYTTGKRNMECLWRINRTKLFDDFQVKNNTVAIAF